MEKNFEINQDGQNIRCKLYAEKGAQLQKVVLFGHGFAGHKDNKAAQKFAERVLAKYKGVAVLVFNLPCHGNDVKKKLLLSDCMTYIHIVLQYIREELHVERIYSYATSFGAFLILKYIAEYGNPFVKIALRCPAIHMAQVLTTKVMSSDELEKIQKGKPVSVGFDRKIEVTRLFLEDLEKTNLEKNDYLEDAESILILHGTKDEVVPFEESARFADENLMEFVPIENADHRFQDPGCMEQATKAVLAFFAF